MLGSALFTVGCPSSKPPEAGNTANANSNAKPELGKDVPPQVANSIKDSQAAGEAYRNKAAQDGAAAGAASNGWR